VPVRRAAEMGGTDHAAEGWGTPRGEMCKGVFWKKTPHYFSCKAISPRKPYSCLMKDKYS